jgi:hypothetical protein
MLIEHDAVSAPGTGHAVESNLRQVFSRWNSRSAEKAANRRLSPLSSPCHALYLSKPCRLSGAYQQLPTHVLVAALTSALQVSTQVLPVTQVLHPPQTTSHSSGVSSRFSAGISVLSTVMVSPWLHLCGAGPSRHRGC